MAGLADDGEYRFGAYALNAKFGYIRRGNRPIPLTEADLRVLLALVRKAGAVATKNELIQAVWGDQPVADGSLTTYISRLRKKLGREMIETAHAKGYRLAEPVERPGSVDELRARYLTQMLREGEEDRQRMKDAEWDERYRPHLPDVRTALDWAFERPGRAEFAIALAGAAARLFQRASQVPAGRVYADRAIALLDDDALPADAAWLLHQAGMLIRESDRQRSLALFQRAEAIYRRLGDKRRLGSIRALIGGALLFLGQHDAARAALLESEKLLEMSVQTKALCNLQNDIGLLYMLTGAPREAARYFGMARDLARMLEDWLREGVILINLGELEFIQGATDRAILRAEEAARILRFAPSTYPAWPIVNLATYCALSSNMARARECAADALRMRCGCSRKREDTRCASVSRSGHPSPPRPGGWPMLLGFSASSVRPSPGRARCGNRQSGCYTIAFGSKSLSI
jgi:DNA-binding winged helix-turn-helix (wHTH) protein